MYNVKKITSDMYWVGASDRRLALFENVYPIPRGVSYNAYVLLDEKTAPATPTAFTPRQLCWGKGMRAGETGYLRAQIDEVYQYNRALTAEEIRTLAGVTAESTTAPTQTAPATPTQPSTVTPDPLEVPARLWWLLIPVVAVVVLLLCLRPWKHRRSRYGKRYSFKR